MGGRSLVSVEGEGLFPDVRIFPVTGTPVRCEMPGPAHRNAVRCDHLRRRPVTTEPGKNHLPVYPQKVGVAFLDGVWALL